MINLKRLSLILIGVLTLFNAPAVLSQNSGQRRVAIIGGGMAGLSSAHFVLANVPGAKITVFEKDSLIGGNAKTFQVDHKGQNLPIDIGAQYFTDGSWDQFITLLKSYQLISNDQVQEFNATLVITNPGKKDPVFISPKGILLRGEKLTNLIQFYRFHKSAHKLYRSESTSFQTVEEWISQQKLTDEFKSEIAYPFLSNTIGVTTEKVKNISVKELVKVFAFRGPSAQQSFYILTNGLGTTLNCLSDSLTNRGVQFKPSTRITSVQLDNNIYTLIHGNQTEDFDFVIFACHPDQAAEVLNMDDDFNELITTLNKFHYTNLISVLHKDSTFVYYKKQSFLNIETENGTNQFISSTQNLGLIDKKFNGIYKSWFTETELNQVKQNGTFIDSKIFYLPLVDKDFMLALTELYGHSSKFNNLFFAGSWSEGVDNQENAVSSGEKAALKCRKFFEKI